MAAAIAMASMANVVARRKMAKFVFFLSAVGVGLTRPNPTWKLNENHDPPTFQNAAATLEAPIQRDPCNQPRPRNQPRPLQPATTHGVNGGDEHESDHPRQRERWRRAQRERRQRERRRRPSQNRNRDLYWWVGQSLFFVFAA